MERQTNEVDIRIGVGEKTEVDTGDPVLDHLLKALLFYSGLEARIDARGDLPHHLWEDTGIVLGEALRAEIGGGEIARYGSAVVPMDDALVLVAIDISRIYLNVDLEVTEAEEGFSTALYREFLTGLVRGLHATLHVKKLAGTNAHHLMEAGIKALGSALNTAVSPAGEVKSTKGVL